MTEHYILLPRKSFASSIDAGAANQILRQFNDNKFPDTAKSDIIPVLRELVARGAQIKIADIVVPPSPTIDPASNPTGRVLEVAGYDGELPALPENYSYAQKPQLLSCKPLSA